MAADSATRTECVAASVNIALGRSAFQSSKYLLGNATADLAVDGNEDGDWRQTSCTATAHSHGPNPWWAVDLASKIFVFQIQIANRVDNVREFLLNNISHLLAPCVGYVCTLAYLLINLRNLFYPIWRMVIASFTATLSVGYLQPFNCYLLKVTSYCYKNTVYCVWFLYDMSIMFIIFLILKGLFMGRKWFFRVPN